MVLRFVRPKPQIWTSGSEGRSQNTVLVLGVITSLEGRSPVLRAYHGAAGENAAHSIAVPSSILIARP